MQQLEAMGMRGFLPEPIEHKGKTYNAWRLESQKLPKPPL